MGVLDARVGNPLCRKVEAFNQDRPSGDGEVDTQKEKKTRKEKSGPQAGALQAKWRGEKKKKNQGAQENQVVSSGQVALVVEKVGENLHRRTILPVFLMVSASRVDRVF